MPIAHGAQTLPPHNRAPTQKQRSSFVYNSEDLAAVLHHALTDFYLYNNP